MDQKKSSARTFHAVRAARLENKNKFTNIIRIKNDIKNREHHHVAKKISDFVFSDFNTLSG